METSDDGELLYPPTEGEINDDGPNYEDILRCLDRRTMDGLRDRDLLDEWTNGERGDTTFSDKLWANAGSTRDGPRGHLTTMKVRINFHLKSRYFFLSLLLGEEAAMKEGRTVDPTFFFFPYFRRNWRRGRRSSD